MVSLTYVPKGLDGIKAAYGDPEHPDREWEDQNLRAFELPYPLRLSWEPTAMVTRVQAHKLVGGAMMDALKEIGEYRGGWYLEKYGYNRFGGIYNPRKKRGIDEWSTHAWGIAIDLNPHLGPLGGPCNMPEFIVEAFVRRGFVWGGTFERSDCMHFQAASGY